MLKASRLLRWSAVWGMFFSPLAMASQPGPLYVVMGGWNSCGNDAVTGQPNPFAKGYGIVRRGVSEVNLHAAAADEWLQKPQWIFTCFDKSGSLYFQATGTGKIERSPQGNLSPIVSLALQRSLKGQRPAMFVGHSHGGWAAAQLAVAVSGRFRRIDIFTIDPISPRECNVSTYAQAVGILFLDPALAWSWLEPCQRNPQDMHVGFRRSLRQSLGESGRWFHFYQHNFTPLHSGAFSGAQQPDVNRDMSPFLSVFPAGAKSSINAHRGIQDLDGIWHMVRTVARH